MPSGLWYPFANERNAPQNGGYFVIKKNLTELVFILDRSGSMGGLKQDTIDYGMPQELREETLKRLPEDIREAYELFWENALDRKVSAD